MGTTRGAGEGPSLLLRALVPSAQAVLPNLARVLTAGSVHTPDLQMKTFRKDLYV